MKNLNGNVKVSMEIYSCLNTQVEVKIATITPFTRHTPTLFMGECNTSVYTYGWFGPNENENKSEIIDTQRCRKIDFPYAINLLNKERMVMLCGNLQLVFPASAQIMINQHGACGDLIRVYCVENKIIFTGNQQQLLYVLRFPSDRFQFH